MIWQGRNQALHWEEGKFSDPVKKCFEQLILDFGAKFSGYTTNNMALEVVEVLDWKTFDKFKADLLSLA